MKAETVCGWKAGDYSAVPRQPLAVFPMAAPFWRWPAAGAGHGAVARAFFQSGNLRGAPGAFAPGGLAACASWPPWPGFPAAIPATTLP